MTLRRVYLSDIDRWPQQDEHDGVPYVLLTVEEYRERIRKAYDYARYYDLYWEYSDIKKQLDKEVGT